MSKTGLRCILCQNFVDNVIEVQNSSSETKSPKIRENYKILEEQIFVIFLLRKILGVPSEFCEDLLSQKGNPSQWLKCCISCTQIVEQLQNLFCRLSTIEKKYNSAREKVRQILQQSKAVNDENPNEPSESADEIRKFIFSDFDTNPPSTNEEMHIKIEPAFVLENLNEEPPDLNFALNWESETEGKTTSGHRKRSKIQSKGKKVKLEGIKRLRNDKMKKERLKDRKNEKCEITRRINTTVNVGGLIARKEWSSSEEVSNDNNSGSESEWDGEHDSVDLDSELSMDEDKNIESRKSKGKTGDKKRKKDSKNKTIETRYGCHECGQGFKFTAQLMAHGREKHCKNYMCFHCVSMFADVAEGHEHYAESHPSLKFKTRNLAQDRNCDVCGEFLLRGSISSHTKQFHSEDSKKCCICSKMFRSQAKLKIHRRGVHYKELGLEPFSCAICQKIFKSPFYCQVHMKVAHEREFRLFCSICSAGMRSENILQDHIRRVHTGEKPFKCSFCQEAFFSKQVLDRHEAVGHTNDFKYTCAICAKRFYKKAGLESHILNVHSEERPFMCELCPHSCKSNFALRIHQRGYHHQELNLEPIQCSECGRTFKSKCGLKNHVVTEHTKDFQFTCNECGKQYANQHLLENHIRCQHRKEARFLCPDCGKPYFTKQLLKSHVERYHTKVFSFKCQFCPKGYSDTWGLKRHMQRIHPDFTTKNM